MNRNRILIAIVIIVVVLVAVAALGLWKSTHPNQPTTSPTNTISLRDLSLCTSNCYPIGNYPITYLSATISVNGSVPLSTLHLFINDTDEGTQTFYNEGTKTFYKTISYPFLFEAEPNNSAMPIVDGRTYTIMVVATFQNGSTYTASATLVAVSDTYGKPQPTFTIVLRSDPTKGCITIAHTGHVCEYNGTIEVQWSKGNYELAAYPNFGFLFVSWNATGGIFIANPTIDTQTMVITGPGTLQANFSALPVPEFQSIVLQSAPSPQRRSWASQFSESLGEQLLRGVPAQV